MSSARCSGCSASTSAGSRRQRASGRRRSAPSPVHGTSASTRVKRPGPPRRARRVGDDHDGPLVERVAAGRAGAPGRRGAARARRRPPGCRRRRRARSAAPPCRPVRPRGRATSPGAAGGRVTPQATSWEPSSCTPARPVRTSGRSAGLPVPRTAKGDQRPGPSAPASATSSSTLGQARPDDQRDLRADVVRGERGDELVGGQQVGVRLDDPARVRVREGEPVQRVAVARRAGRPSPSRSCAATLRSTALTRPVTRRPTVAPARSTVSLTAACVPTRMPRTWWAPSRSRSTTAGCSVDSARPEAASRIAS